jgi:hypothetical protein
MDAYLFRIVDRCEANLLRLIVTGLGGGIYKVDPRSLTDAFAYKLFLIGFCLSADNLSTFLPVTLRSVVD